MAINNYTFSFKSLRSGNIYTVNIGGGSGAAIPLIPAAQPFTTEEDIDDDVFTPIRTQSGYLRIVDDGSIDWKDLMPFTDVERPLTLTQGGTVVWQGFMQSQNFSGTLYGGTQEREFPIQCPLASAGTQDIILATNPVTELKNFAYYLKSIVDYISTVSGGTVSFQYIYIQGGTYGRNALLQLIDPQNFLTLDLDENTVEPKYSKYDVLEDICRYWGFTARTYGRNLYLMMTNGSSSAFYRLDSTDLATMAGGQAAGTSVTVSGVTLGNVFASMDNEVTVQRGYSKATVKGDAGSGFSDVLKCFPKPVEDSIDASANPESESWGDDTVTYTGKITSFTSINMEGSAVTNKASFRRGWIYQGLLNTDNAESDMIYIGSQYDGNSQASINTVYEHNYSGMLFKINATAYCHGMKLDFTENNLDYGTHVMFVEIFIGKVVSGTKVGRWYNGSSWQTTKASCAVTIGNKGNTMFVRTGTSDNYHYNEKISVPRVLGTDYVGNLYIDFLGTNEYTIYHVGALITYNFFLTGFSLSAELHGSLDSLPADWDDSSKERTASNSNIVQEEWNADCIFCSYGNVKYGFGILTSPSDGTYDTQEQNLADRVAAGTGQTTGYWCRSKLMYRTELLANDGTVSAISPQHEVTVAGTPCLPISIGREWRDDVAKILFIQKS